MKLGSYNDKGLK